MRPDDPCEDRPAFLSLVILVVLFFPVFVLIMLPIVVPPRAETRKRLPNESIEVAGKLFKGCHGIPESHLRGLARFRLDEYRFFRCHLQIHILWTQWGMEAVSLTTINCQRSMQANSDDEASTICVNKCVVFQAVEFFLSLFVHLGKAVNTSLIT